MKIGITYDTGFSPAGRNTRPHFDHADVAFDMTAIARDLRCDAVRITGGDAERLTVAAELAAEAGLEVWFSPFPCELGTGEMLALYENCAARAESLRRRAEGKVVLVLGCEVSLFGAGFLPGADAYARMRELSAPGPELIAGYGALVARLNEFLARAADTARTKFAGPVTYASGLWEPVDWSPFAIVGVDAYRDQGNAATLGQQLDGLSAHGKAVAVTEFGCCPYRGAAERGANGWAIVEEHDGKRGLDGEYTRDENEQVTYLRELLGLYRQHGVDTAFWFTFAAWDRPHRENPRKDLDISSFGVVKLLQGQTTPESRWRPKAVYGEFAKIAGP